MIDPKPEPASYNTPVDDPHHYDFENADVPPDSSSPQEGHGAGPVVDS